MKTVGRFPNVSSRRRKLIGFGSAIPAAFALATVGDALHWRDDTLMFAGLLMIACLVPLVLPFMMGPLVVLEPSDPGYQPRGSLWQLVPCLLAPGAGAIGYHVARPYTVHWGAAGCVGVYSAVGWLLFCAVVFLRRPKASVEPQA